MSVGVNPPKTPVTKGSNGVATATLPNVCKMPGPPAPFVPAPLPNIGKSGNSIDGYTTTVKVEGNPVAITGASFCSIGDMASKGTGGGMVSANTHGPCKFIGPGSMDVKFEGGNVQLLSDPTTNNGASGGTPANAATMMGLVQGIEVVYNPGDGDLNCPHPNIKMSDPDKEKRRRAKQDMKQSKAETKSESKFRRAVKAEAAGKVALANDLMNQAIEAARTARGAGFEQDVTEETDSKLTSIEFECPDCGMRGEIDTITDDGTIKECKQSANAVDVGQFRKIVSAAAVLFPGAPVHVAVPAGQAGAVTPDIPRDAIQTH